MTSPLSKSPVASKTQHDRRQGLEIELAQSVGEALFNFHQPERATSNGAISDTEKLYATLRWPALLEIAEPLSPQIPGQRGQLYPSGLLLALAGWSLHLRSRDEVEAHLREGIRWVAIRKIWLDQTGEVLPANPPGANHIDVFYRRCRAYTRKGQGIHASMERFRAESIALARELGGLDPDAVFDPLSPHLNNTIYGDGTYINPNSSVKSLPVGVDENGEVERVYQNSRSKSTGPKAQGPRVQTVLTASHEDGKAETARGINFIHLLYRSTRIRERVVLDVSPSIGAESKTAIPMLLRLIQLCKGSVHTIVWDMATGLTAQKITPQSGAVLIQKKPGKPNMVEELPTILKLQEMFGPQYRRWLLSMQQTSEWKGLTRTDKQKAQAHHLTSLWQEQARSEVGIAGVTVRNRAGGLQVRRSDITSIQSVQCGIVGTKCPHWLAWEDGTLIEVQANGSNYIRKQVARRVGISRQYWPLNGWSIQGTWSLECEIHGSWKESAYWSASELTEDQYVASVLPGWTGDVVSEIEGELFYQKHGVRNDIESFHQLLKRSLKFDRANTLQAEDQWLDMISLAVSTNATTYALHHGKVNGVGKGPRELTRTYQNKSLAEG